MDTNRKRTHLRKTYKGEYVLLPCFHISAPLVVAVINFLVRSDQVELPTVHNIVLLRSLPVGMKMYPLILVMLVYYSIL